MKGWICALLGIQWIIPVFGAVHWGYYKVRFDFKGTASHAGGAPELGRSALDACELMNVGVNYLREHIISSARVHYAYLDAGGDAPNIVQDHASLLLFCQEPQDWPTVLLFWNV